MKISEEECQIGELTDSNLAIALRLLRESGYVILESVLPRNLVEELQTAFNQLLMPNMENQQKDSNWNRRGGCHALYGMPFMHPLVIENSLGLQIIEEAMGKDIWTLLPYHTNTTFPGASMQHIHRDTQHLFPELPYALPLTMIILHIPLIDFNESNGSTQVWPGTHLITDIDSDASQSGQLEERAKSMPSARTNIPAGSLVVRDMRVWHRGTPNRTQTVRTMTSIVYFRQLHRFPQHLTHLASIPQAAVDLMSERAQHLCHYNPIE